MKKKLLSLSLALALCLGLTVPAMAAGPSAIATVRGDEVVGLTKDDTDAIIVKAGGKYGAYKLDGTQLAAPTYAYAKAYSEGMAAVTVTGATEVVGEDSEIEEFMGGKYGYVDDSGKLVIPMKYAKAFDFHDGRAFVRETEDGPLLMIDKTGKVIATYENVNLWYYETVQFSEGLAIIPTSTGGYAEDVETYLVVDTSGKTVYTQEGGYLDFENGYHDGLVAMAESCIWPMGGGIPRRFHDELENAGYRDKTGKKVISGDYNDVFAFSDGLATVAKYDDDYQWHCGFIDTTGKLVVPIEYNSYWHCRNGIAAVNNGQGDDVRGALVDRTGKFLTDFLYYYIWEATDDGLIPVQAPNGPITVLDKTGKTVFTSDNCTTSTLFLDGLACMFDASGKGYVYDAKGNDVTPMAFSDGFVTDMGYVWLKSGDTYSVFRTADLTAAASAPAPAPAPEPAPAGKPVFTDVAENSPFKDAIAWAVEKGVTNGTTPTTFGPSSTCTHNHILTFLWRANGSPAAEGEGDFAKAAAWARSKGLLSGDAFDGGAACTRSQTMMYLWKLAGSPETAVNSAFADVAADADYAQAVAWAVEKGITNGISASAFGPDNTCTRGQIVTFLYRNLAK